MNKLIEKELKLYGFKKRWLDDRSGFWWEKKLSKEAIMIIDLELNHFYIDHKIYKLWNHVWQDNGWETIKHFKSLNEALKWLNKE